MSTQAEVRAAALAQEPMREAGPRSGFASGTLQSIRDIWAHRELLDLLIRRELKARYKDSTLGFFWSLMRPLTMLLIYYVAIGKFLGAERSIPEFAIYVFTGLTAWQLFSEVVASGTSSIVSNSGLIKKVYLPREVFPLSTTGSALFNFAIQLGILVLATIVLGAFRLDSRLLYLPLSFAVLLTWGLALALLLSAVNVYLRDVQYLVEISLMVLMWASPIVYSWAQVSNAVGSSWLADLYLANPTTLAVLGFQRTFWSAGENEPYPAHLASRLGIALLIGLVLLWLFQRVFTRLQSNFAQEL
ncbi:MAG TPA: ABC transporter permease [Cellulomonas sp.]